jgi:hypothetical protein
MHSMLLGAHRGWTVMPLEASSANAELSSLASLSKLLCC